jgi:hypothetical protein
VHDPANAAAMQTMTIYAFLNILIMVT